MLKNEDAIILHRLLQMAKNDFANPNIKLLEIDSHHLVDFIRCYGQERTLRLFASYGLWPTTELCVLGEKTILKRMEISDGYNIVYGCGFSKIIWARRLVDGTVGFHELN